MRDDLPTFAALLVDPIVRELVRWGIYDRQDETLMALANPTVCPWAKGYKAAWNGLEDLGWDDDNPSIVEAGVRDMSAKHGKAYEITLRRVYCDPGGLRMMQAAMGMDCFNAALFEAQEALRPILRQKGLAV